MATSNGWFYWAILSAVFAALTTIFAKIGIQGINSDFATLIRTAIILVVLSAFVAYAGNGPIRSNFRQKPGCSLDCLD